MICDTLTSVTFVSGLRIRNSSNRTAMITTSQTLFLIHFPLIMRWASNFEQTADQVSGREASVLIIAQGREVSSSVLLFTGLRHKSGGWRLRLWGWVRAGARSWRLCRSAARCDLSSPGSLLDADLYLALFCSSGCYSAYSAHCACSARSAHSAHSACSCRRRNGRRKRSPNPCPSSVTRTTP